MLAPMAEEGWTENEIAKLAIHEYIKDFSKIDALVLGCTHYPLYTKILEEELPNVKIINTGTMIAYEIEKILNAGLENNKKNSGKLDIYLSDTECNFIDVAKKILNVSKLDVKQCEI